MSSSFGMALAVLGIFVAAQPLIRAGVRTTARWQFVLGEEITSIEAADAARRVFKERVYGVMLIVIGTLLYGDAPAIARLFGLPLCRFIARDVRLAEADPVISAADRRQIAAIAGEMSCRRVCGARL